jgi:hypothetical protein
MPKNIKKETWVPIAGYEESISKADFTTKAGLYKKLSNPSFLEIVDPRIQKLYVRSASSNEVIPFLDMVPEKPGMVRQMLIDRGTAIHNKLQEVLSSNGLPLKVNVCRL